MTRETREPFGGPQRERTEGDAGEIGQGRAGLHESRYVEDPDYVVRIDHSQPLDEPPPPQETSEASQADADRRRRRPDRLTATPPGPSIWEAREPEV